MHTHTQNIADSDLAKELYKIQLNLKSYWKEPEEIPYLNAYRDFHNCINGFSRAATWADFTLSASYRLYHLTGDSSVLKENYLFMSRWIQFLRERAETQHPGEKEISYYIYCLKRMAKIARILNLEEDAELYELLVNLHFHSCDCKTPAI